MAAAGAVIKNYTAIGHYTAVRHYSFTVKPNHILVSLSIGSTVFIMTQPCGVVLSVSVTNAPHRPVNPTQSHEPRTKFIKKQAL